jgi:hypothetical protein
MLFHFLIDVLKDHGAVYCCSLSCITVVCTVLVFCVDYVNYDNIVHTKHLRNLKQRYKEYIRYIRNNDPPSAYATHIIDNLHEYGDINDNMSMLKQTNKGPYMKTLEQFYIQLFAYNNKLIPEQNTGEYNPIFRFIYDIQKRHSPT